MKIRSFYLSVALCVLTSFLLCSSRLNAQYTYNYGSPIYSPPPCSTANISSYAQRQTENYYVSQLSGSSYNKNVFYLKYAPANYTTTGAGFPLIIFIEGAGRYTSANENQLCGLRTHGSLTSYINYGPVTGSGSLPAGIYPPMINNNFVLISPNPDYVIAPGAGFTPALLDELIDMAMSTYNIDPTKIYLMGSSAGANIILQYIRASECYANRIAAAVVFSPTGADPANICNTFVKYKVPLWQFSTTNDPYIGGGAYTTFVNQINSCSNPSATPAARYTPYSGCTQPCHFSESSKGGDDRWFKYIKGQNVPEYNQNIYDWMISYNRDQGNGQVAYYPFSGNANDASGNNNHGYTVGGVTLTTDWYGNANSAYSFDGVDDCIVVPNSATLNPDYITISAWVQSDPTTHQTPDILRKSYDYNASSEQYLLRLTNNGNGIQAGVKFPTTGCNDPSWKYSNVSYQSQSVWRMVSMTFDGAYVRTYNNGLLLNQTATTQNVLAKCGAEIRIGKAWTYYPNFFKGKMDDIRIFNRALSACELKTIWGDYDFNFPNARKGSISKEIQEESSIVIYPNPTSTGFIEVEGITSETFTVNVFDLVGTKVLSRENQSKIEINALSQGMYIININDHNGKILKVDKFIKQ